MCNSTCVEVFYGFVKINTRPKVNWFHNKIFSLRYFYYNLLKKIEDVF